MDRGGQMTSIRKEVEEAAAFIRSRLAALPEIALILGTGLGEIAEPINDITIIPYEEIPNFPSSTAPSHRGQLFCGHWGARSVMIMQGRFHLYEGYTAKQVSFPIRVMAALGVKTLILCSASGGLNPQFKAGDLMLVTDHINLTGQNPLVGPNVDESGPRFPDMVEPYSQKFRALAIDAALSERIPLHRGVYVGVLGPSLETAAETRFLRAIGADAVGMSMVMEDITAVHAGMSVLGISVITNVNLPDHYMPASVEDIVATAMETGPKLMRLLSTIIAEIKE